MARHAQELGCLDDVARLVKRCGAQQAFGSLEVGASYRPPGAVAAYTGGHPQRTGIRGFGSTSAFALVSSGMAC